MKPMMVLALALASSMAIAQPAGTAPAPKAVATPSPAEFDKQATQVNDDIKKMQEQMDRIQRTQDPKERQRLLQDHWATMQNAMGLMHGMWAPGMLGCCGSGPGMGGGHMMGGGPMMGGGMRGGMMGWGNAGNFYSNLSPEQLRQRQYMADQYLAMQQQMMNHMMWQQYWTAQPAPAPK